VAGQALDLADTVSEVAFSTDGTRNTGGMR